jgi:hypothetical protein
MELRVFHKGEHKRRATPGPGLTVPYAAREYIRIRITKAWELRAGLVNPNSYPTES